jgi:2-iminoacetate synthase ThiH
MSRRLGGGSSGAQVPASPTPERGLTETRIDIEEARTLWLEAPDDELRRLAQSTRARFHEPDQATYMVMRIVNYTNVCVA